MVARQTLFRKARREALLRRASFSRDRFSVLLAGAVPGNG
jgi:hypothetical protein